MSDQLFSGTLIPATSRTKTTEDVTGRSTGSSKLTALGGVLLLGLSFGILATIFLYQWLGSAPSDQSNPSTGIQFSTLELDLVRQGQDQAAIERQQLRNDLAAAQEQLATLQQQQKESVTTIQYMSSVVTDLQQQPAVAPLAPPELPTQLLDALAQQVKNRIDQQQLLIDDNKTNINGLNSLYRAISSQLNALQYALRQAPPVPATTSKSNVVRYTQPPFSLIAIDGRAPNVVVTVAEPPLGGRRRVSQLRKGQSHLGWTVDQINIDTVTFTHASGTQYQAALEG